ncbi:MAG: long-chain fatty acid--CoA ligase [Planctomycetota bacterium]|nr:long-chain fatty acid--CoA ligase [Planctomycetota bacterium]
MLGLMMNFPLTIDRILEHARRLYPHREVITKLPNGEIHRQNYLQTYSRVKRMAKALGTLGVKEGDRVGTFAWNNYQHLELYYAIPGAGAVCHTLNIRLFPEQLTYIINHAEDKVIFIDATLLPLFEPIAGSLKGVEHFVIFNHGSDFKTTLPNVSFYEDLIDASDDDFEWVTKDENSAMGLCYTSGTTGEPKGALYSHRSMVLHTFGINQSSGLGTAETDAVLPVVPQFHAMAWGLPYACLMAGANLVMPGPHLKGPALLDLIDKEKVTVAAGVPSIWTDLYHTMKRCPEVDTSSMRVLMVGGSAMPRALIEAYEKEKGINVLHAWGMTELSPLGTVCHLQSRHQHLSDSEKWDTKACQGTPVFGVETRIVDEENNEQPWDGKAVGELQVRGSWVIRQYYKLEKSESFTDDGWFRTGDVATISPEGYMKLTDRVKDLVKSGGEWISSVELENALMAHDDVLEAAVIAVPDEKWAERPLAVVVRTEQGSVDSEGLRAFLAPNFAKFWLPDRFVFAPQIPKTSVGKFDKKRIRVQVADGTLN